MRPSAAAAIVIVVSVLAFSPGSTAYAEATIQVIDSAGDVGNCPSLKLDGAGNPVIAYRDEANKTLKVVHCDDPACAPGGEVISSVSQYVPNDVGKYSSLELDASGNPVVSFADETLGALVVMHCDDPNCAFPGDTLRVIDIASTPLGVVVGTSLKLDASGNPVIAYFDSITDDLKVAHCTDPNCLGVIVTAPDTEGVVGIEPSLALDAAGNPVISYNDDTNDRLRIMHCNDPNCDPSPLGNGPESITSPAAMNPSFLHKHAPLELDASGNPVVAYPSGFGGVSVTVRVLHCDDPNCDGIGESDTVPDPGFAFQWRPSLALDARGWPVLSYSGAIALDGATFFTLRVLHCDDADCAGGDEPIADVDLAFADRSSITLDARGNPVVAYYDSASSQSMNQDLKLAHCSDAKCKQGGPPH